MARGFLQNKNKRKHGHKFNGKASKKFKSGKKAKYYHPEIALNQRSEDVKATQQEHVPRSSSSESEDEGKANSNAYQSLVASLAPDQSTAYLSNSDYDDDESENDGSEEEEVSDEDDDEDDDDVSDLKHIAKDVLGADNAEGDDSDQNSGSGSDEDTSKSDSSEDAGDSSSSSDEEAEVEEAIDDDDQATSFEGIGDPFSLHFERDLEDSVTSKLSEMSSWEKCEIKIPEIGKCSFQKPKGVAAPNPDYKETDIKKMHVKQMIGNQVAVTNESLVKVNVSKEEPLTSFQYRLFAIINSYKDLYFSERTQESGEELRLLYSMHALNHIIKTRNRIISHNTKLKASGGNIDEEFRDQGLTRPKVLIVVPFREAANRIVNMMISLMMPGEKIKNVLNHARFMREYGLEEEDPAIEKKQEDYREIFKGNTDDHFRIGVGVAKKTLKLYSEFYKSDIIIASPLGLRTAIGAEGDRDRDFDFLSSIEVLVMDQMDIFHMQNWDHIQHILKHMHIQPQKSHDVDFSRTRMWTLNGLSKYYMQTLMFSSMPTPAINSIFNKQCRNWAGKVLIPHTPSRGTIRQIITQIPQVLHRVDVPSFAEAPTARFQFFLEKILPQVRNDSMSGVMIFIPSYFDFVRLRNHFKKESINFVFVNEYTKEKTITRSRDLFFHGRVNILMYTERCHFYRRFRIRGIRHLVFYDLPLYAHFYSEICNYLQDPKKAANSAEDDTHSCYVLYTKYDAQRLAAIVGNTRASQMLTSVKSMHMLVTGEG